MIIQSCLEYGRNKLKNNNNSNSSLEPEILLSFVLKNSKEYVLAHPQKTVSKKQITQFKNIINQRKKGVPIAYIIKEKEFYGLNFYVDKNVLIPRPETEMMVELADNWIKLHNSKTIIDLGTGSGAIAISLKKLNPKAKIIAVDLSKKALKVALKNARKNKVKITFTKGNLLDPVIKQNPDVICANLPYLRDNYLKKLPKQISQSLKYEPKMALAAGKDGLKIYCKLFGQIKKSGIKFNFLIIEIDNNQKKSAIVLAKKYFPNAKIEIKKDLAKLNRFLMVIP